MRKSKLFERTAIGLASAVVIAGGALTLDARMAFATEQTEVTEIPETTTAESEVIGDLDYYAGSDEEIKDYIYDSKLNDKTVTIIESATRTQESDIRYEIALDKALNLVKEMSGVDVSEAYTQIVLTPEYVDEGEYGYERRREYNIFFDIKEDGTGDGYSVSLDAVTGEIFMYTYWNCEAAAKESDFEDAILIGEKNESEYIDIAKDFVEKKMNLGDVETVYGFDICQKGAIDGVRYCAELYCKTFDGDIISISIDCEDKEVYCYEIIQTY